MSASVLPIVVMHRTWPACAAELRLNPVNPIEPRDDVSPVDGQPGRPHEKFGLVELM